MVQRRELKIVLKCAAKGYRVMDMNFLDCTNFDTPFRTERWEEWVHELAELANENM